MPTLALNAPLPSEKNARKNAPQPKSGGKSAPKSKRENADKPKPQASRPQGKRKYNKKSDYWNKKKRK